MSTATSRIFNSASLRFIAGSMAYGAYISSPPAVLANAAAGLIVLGMNIHSERAGYYGFLVNGVVNLVSAALILKEAAQNIAASGLTTETFGQASVGFAYLGWSIAEAMKVRLDLKGIEMADKKYLDPVFPNSISDVLAVGAFPPLMATSALALLKTNQEVAEDAPVSNHTEFAKKHISSTRLLALGTIAAGIAGVATGLGAFYGTAFTLWALGYIAFEPKRNAAFISDWKNLAPKT